MTVRIDGAGRTVVPKAVRDRLGLRARTEVELIEKPDGAYLKMGPERPVFSMKDGLLIHHGTAEKHAVWDSIIEDVREERIRSVLS